MLLSDNIDRKMDKIYFNSENQCLGINLGDLVLIKIINMFICPILSPKNKEKLNKI